MSGTLDELVDFLRAAGEPSRLRILGLLREDDLAVGELVEILGLSQPGISQHLKTLSAAGLVERLPEGSWVYYRIVSDQRSRAVLDALFALADLGQGELARDRERLASVRAARAASADTYFQRNAENWDRIRALHYPNDAIEQAVLEAVGDGPFSRCLDIGTGTGRMLTLLAPLVEEAEGVDRSHDMLTVARANLARDGVANARVRQGDATALPYDDASVDLITIHQVLHYMERPDYALAEAARVLAPSGRLVVVDFAPHDHEFLRADHAHRHLGLSADALVEWAEGAGLSALLHRRFDPPAGAQTGLAVQVLIARKTPDPAGVQTQKSEVVA